MEEIRKEKLIHYLFPNEQIRYFLCEDLFVELYELIPKRLCISSTNFTNATRKENLKQVANIIEKFLKENSDYKIALKKCFPNKPTDIILRDLIIGYVFYLLNVLHPRITINTINIFRDKQCICYSPISVIDIL